MEFVYLILIGINKFLVDQDMLTNDERKASTLSDSDNILRESTFSKQQDGFKQRKNKTEIEIRALSIEQSNIWEVD